MKLASAPAELVVMFQGNLFAQRGLEALVEAAAKALSRRHSRRGSAAERARTHRQGGAVRPHASGLPERKCAAPAGDGRPGLGLLWRENPNTALACSGKFYNAVYAGVPVVCNPLPAFRAFAEQHGGVFFINSLTTQSLRARLTELLADRSARRSASEAMALAAAGLAGTPRAERLIAAVETLWAGRA